MRSLFNTRKADRDSRGAAAVEFALILVPLLVIVFGVLQYGLYFFSSQTGSAAAREGVRRASIGACTDAQLKTFIYERIKGGAISGTESTLTVQRTFHKADGATTVPSPGEVGGLVRVKIVFPSYDLNFPFLPFLDDATVTKLVDARLESTVSSGACV